MVNLNAARARRDAMISYIRRYGRDYGGIEAGGLNRLIDGHESSDEDISFAIHDFLSFFNSTGHLTQYNLLTYPEVGMWLLIRGVQLTLLEGVILLGIRNYASYSDGGMTFSSESRLPLLQQTAGMLRDQVSRGAMQLKATLNLEEAMAGELGAVSEYMWVNNVYQPGYISWIGGGTGTVGTP